MPPMLGRRGMAGRHSGGGNVANPTTNIGAAAVASKPSKPRTEFVIMFFWQEPTPSDQLMKLGTSAAPAGPR